MKQITTKIETITPSKARKMLEKNTSNRSIKPATVKLYSTAMKAGEWKLNGEGIIMNEDVLLNGQHRLHACIDADTPFMTLVVHGVESSAFKTMDRHTKRSNGNVLGILGYKYGNYLSSAANFIHMVRTHAGKKTPTAARNTEKTNYFDIEDFMVENPGLVESVRFANEHSFMAKFMVSTAAAALHYMASFSGRERADEFIEGIATGINLPPGDPRLVLRNHLINRFASRNKERSEIVMARYIYAWNAWVSGRTVSRLIVGMDTNIPKMIS